MRPVLVPLACVAACLAALAAVLPAAPGRAAAPAGTDDTSQGAPSATVPPSSRISRGQIRAATAGLAVAGYAPGPVDGDWGAADRAALRAYQADWRLAPTGALTPDLVLRLIRDHPATAPRWVRTAEGCRVWNRYPQPRETVTWSGACVDGATTGLGRLVWTSVLRGLPRIETYVGQRRDGRENGVGRHIGVDGSRYLGTWRDGLEEGFGTYVSPRGHVYTGGYRNGLRDGIGAYRRTEGASYLGQWRAGVEHGLGVALWPDGSRYEGWLADGTPEGPGTLSFPGGAVYRGIWRAGCLAQGLRGAAAGVTLADCGWQ